MAVSKNRKQQQLEVLIDKFQNAKSIFFSEYTGISVKDFGKVRDTLRESNVECKVAKKTLIKLAAEQIGIKEIPTEALEGPIAVILSNEDEIAGAKLISNLKKEYETLELTGGIFDGEAFGQDKAKAYAAIPAKEELLAKLVGSMKAPISGFHGVTHGVMRQFVGTLQAIVDNEQ